MNIAANKKLTYFLNLHYRYVYLQRLSLLNSREKITVRKMLQPLIKNYKQLPFSKRFDALARTIRTATSKANIEKCDIPHAF